MSQEQIDGLSVELAAPGWEEAGLRIFEEQGLVVVLGVLSEEERDFVLKDCEEQAALLLEAIPGGNRGTNRYSFGNASLTDSMFHVESWPILLQTAGSDLRPLLDSIFEGKGFSCIKSGGDFVLGETRDHQALHADLCVSKAHNVRLPPPVLSVNFVVQALTPSNGPMRIVPGTQLLRGDVPERVPPGWVNSRLCPLPAGSVIIRDVRTLHSGSPNLTSATRYLPSVEFASEEYRGTGPLSKCGPCKSMPRRLFSSLTPDVQELCDDLVYDDDGAPEVGFKTRSGRARWRK